MPRVGLGELAVRLKGRLGYFSSLKERVCVARSDLDSGFMGLFLPAEKDCFGQSICSSEGDRR